MADQPAPNALREARLQFRENQIDPNGELPPEERRRRALEEDAAFYRRIGERSGESRRKRAALLESIQQRARDRVLSESVAS
jgi:hypothetical protein